MAQDNHIHPSARPGHRRAAFKHTCDCVERQKSHPEDRNWVVIDRNRNYSAFNGYRYDWSRYSAINCHTCGACWRTKAAYVGLLQDGKHK